jgi:very-short-patch-repair endonuclease
LASLAATQDGVVCRSQLAALGFGRGAIAHRVRAGRLHPLYPSVFSVGYPRRDSRARNFAALLHAGADAVLSHGTALAVWGLGPALDDVHITRVAGHVREQPGLRVFRVAALDIRDVRLCQGLPVTSPARTVLDVAADADDDETERILAEARVQGLVSDAELQGALNRAPNRPGARRLRRILRGVAGQAVTRSKAERMLLRLIVEAELPPPEINARVRGLEVDFLWRGQNLVVEFDGAAFHSHERARKRDRRRDRRLIAAGFRIIRVSWRQLTREPMALVARIAQALVAT